MRHKRAVRNPDAKRIARYRSGMLGEWWATRYMNLRGYRRLYHRYKTPFGEIDLIMQRGGTVVFLEIKTRHNATQEVLSARQRERISNAARYFIAQHRQLAGCMFRFDLLIMRPWRWPHYIPHAWEV